MTLARVGAAKDCRDCVMLTLGTGIGGGIVIDGRLYGGFNNFGGEFGHTVILAEVSRAAAASGDKAATDVVARYIEHLALGMMNVIKIFQPEVIVIGGGISHAGEQLPAPLTERVMCLSYRDYVPTEKRTRIVAAQLGNDAGIVGAALLGI